MATSTSSSPEERATLVVVAALSALIAITCGSEGALAPPPAAPAAAPVAEQAKAPSPQVPSGTSSGPQAAAPAAPQPSSPSPGLERFFAALDELEQKRRREHVRITWLGDSHTAADFWTGVVRRSLAARFGAGGPGFVRAGVQAYRHDDVKLGRDGRFRIQPDPPARRFPQGDGVFGLGGMRVLPDLGAKATLEVQQAALSGQLSFEVWYRLPPGAELRVELGTRVVNLNDKSDPLRVEGSPISRFRLHGAAGERLVLVASAGQPELFGVIAEGSEPGIVLDTVGIDGARLATPLAWAEEPFIAEVRARAPALYVLAYGTNEVFDAVRVERYADQLKALVGRFRRGAPQADCLIVGPPDAAARGGGSEPRVGEIDRLERRTAEELGCAFLSALELMGGEGSFARYMQATPRLARPDRIHLTPKGYEMLGQASADELLRRYVEFKARSPR
jgi:lysophospholipase L1-like esterase/predicted small lipoprotein YifL